MSSRERVVVGREYGGERRVEWRVETFLSSLLAVVFKRVSLLLPLGKSLTYQHCLAGSLDTI